MPFQYLCIHSQNNINHSKNHKVVNKVHFVVRNGLIFLYGYFAGVILSIDNLLKCPNIIFQFQVCFSDA